MELNVGVGDRPFADGVGNRQHVRRSATFEVGQAGLKRAQPLPRGAVVAFRFFELGRVVPQSCQFGLIGRHHGRRRGGRNSAAKARRPNFIDWNSSEPA